MRDDRPPFDDAAVEEEVRRARKRRRRGVAALLGAAVVLWFVAPLGLRHLDYFTVRRVEIVGTRYIPPSSITELMAVDSTKSVWDDLSPIEARVAEHPQVRSVTVSRRLPGTLVVRVVENLPVALVSTGDGLHPYDRDGVALPIDPSRTRLDLPVITRRDTIVLRLLDDIRMADASVFARINEVLWDERGGLRVLMSGVTVRASADCEVARFLEIIPVEQDLARRGVRAAELDLRFRDQIIARLE